ncbi:hypothetical protein [Anderseniella sp. Alg231-50]|uniref:hypothetical protein n=1 Tax=Anderseniella sp. Alg231-50 TaxID=1922226 RepID=UPI00307C1EFB
MSRRSFIPKLYLAALAITVAMGALPVALNLAVDPYNRLGGLPLGLAKKKISEKAHYPLWKIIAHSNKRPPETIVLGDSRARALRDKYWSETGLKRAFNFAYGGATIYEIHETFRYLKTQPKPKNLVVGIQLRSFDPAHKSGMNRVPEALRLAGNPVKYFSSWFVTRISWRHVQEKYPGQLAAIGNLSPGFISTAQAADLGSPGHTSLSTLLQPDVCFGCRLPEQQQRTAYPAYGHRRGHGYGFGREAGLWRDISIERQLPARFERQVRKNGRSDWKSFRFSEDLWAKVVEIADWSKANGVKLVFVIPPTIVEMQARLAEFGRADLDRNLRLRLADLAPVIDLDFDNPFTRDLTNFKDAYHFNAPVARNIVAEIGQLLTTSPEVRETALKVRSGLACPTGEQGVTRELNDGIIKMTEGTNCRIWRRANDPS